MPKRRASPEFLAVSPQSISVDVPIGGGGEIERRVENEFRHQLPKLGYHVVPPGTAADAELHFYLDGTDTRRDWYSGVHHASVSIVAELRSPLGTLWDGGATGYGSEESDDEDEDRNDVIDVLLGAGLDAVEDSLFEPDYSEEFAEAAHDAVALALLTFPKRHPPRPAAPTTRGVSEGPRPW